MSQDKIFLKRLSDGAKTLGISLPEDKLKAFELYFSLLQEWNEKINLTSVSSEEMAEKHFIDSLSAATVFDFNKIDNLLDIGTGAGFPGLPLKILYPKLEVTLLDSSNKRVTFLEVLTKRLGLKGVRCVHARAEDFALRKEGNSFSVVVARAVSEMGDLLKLSLPFLKPGGILLAYKGPKIEDELAAVQGDLSSYGAKVTAVHDLTLPLSGSKRSIVLIERALES